MTLQDAVDEWYYSDQTKRIIREPNKRGWCDVWFEFKLSVGLIVCSWEYSIEGMYINKRVAPFQQSKHNDWILI